MENNLTSPEITTQRKIYMVAQGEVGIAEVVGSNDNPRILEYHQATSLKATHDEVAWCSAFVNWCFKQEGLNGTLSAAARSWLSFGTPIHIDECQEGDIIILARGDRADEGHVGFFVSLDEGFVSILGGNQSNMVCVRKFEATRILGIRRYIDTPDLDKLCKPANQFSSLMNLC